MSSVWQQHESLKPAITCRALAQRAHHNTQFRQRYRSVLVLIEEHEDLLEFWKRVREGIIRGYDGKVCRSSRSCVDKWVFEIEMLTIKRKMLIGFYFRLSAGWGVFKGKAVRHLNEARTDLCFTRHWIWLMFDEIPPTRWFASRGCSIGKFSVVSRLKSRWQFTIACSAISKLSCSQLRETTFKVVPDATNSGRQIFSRVVYCYRRYLERLKIENFAEIQLKFGSQHKAA